MRAIDELSPLAPLHNAPALAAIERGASALPGRAARRGLRHRLPRHASRRRRRRTRCRDAGARSGACAATASTASPCESVVVAESRSSGCVVCHLGGGCSVTAVRDGARSTRRWASARSRACRWPRARARSTRARSSTAPRAGLTVEELDGRSSTSRGSRPSAASTTRSASPSTRTDRRRGRADGRRAGRPRRARVLGRRRGEPGRREGCRRRAARLPRRLPVEVVAAREELVIALRCSQRSKPEQLRPCPHRGSTIRATELSESDGISGMRAHLNGRPKVAPHRLESSLSHPGGRRFESD